MAIFDVYNTKIEVDDNLIKYLDHMHWLENEKIQLLSKIENMIKNKADYTEFSGIHTEDYAIDGDCIMKTAEIKMEALNFEISAIEMRDSKSSTAYNQIVSEEFDRVKGLDFGVITNNFIGYMLYP